MIEPTESESKAELDRFVDALLAIRAEVADIEAGRVPLEQSALRNAPHTATDLLREEWARPYTREQGAFPLPWVKARKYWPPVRRIDNVHGRSQRDLRVPAGRGLRPRRRRDPDPGRADAAGLTRRAAESPPLTLRPAATR